MKLSKLLLTLGLFAKDAKLRINSGQITINGEKTTDIDIDVEIVEDKPNIVDAGTFLFYNIVPNPVWNMRCQIFGVDALWCVDNDLSKYFSDFLFLKISKKEMYVITLKK